MTKQEQINRLLSEVEGGGSYRNFSKPENFIRLLKIATRKSVRVRIDAWKGEIEVESLDKHIPYYHRFGQIINQADIPANLSELLAEALGWKEGE